MTISKPMHDTTSVTSFLSRSKIQESCIARRTHTSHISANYLHIHDYKPLSLPTVRESPGFRIVSVVTFAWRVRGILRHHRLRRVTSHAQRSVSTRSCAVRPRRGWQLNQTTGAPIDVQPKHSVDSFPCSFMPLPLRYSPRVRCRHPSIIPS